MTVSLPAKAGTEPPRIVAVIRSPADLRRALRMRRPPDLFELRLDALANCLDEVARAIPKLRPPLIITARDPREGGDGGLTIAQRRELLLRFLRDARYVDVELRSRRELRQVIAAARAANVGVILSLHDFAGTPSLSELRKKLVAVAAADIFKVATTVASDADVQRLLEFFDEANGKRTIAAMGMGTLGREARRVLARRGSALNYCSLGDKNQLGQLSVAETRRILRRFEPSSFRARAY